MDPLTNQGSTELDFERLLAELFDNRMDLILPDLRASGTFPSFALTLEDIDSIGIVLINSEDLVGETPSSATEMVVDGLQRFVSSSDCCRAVLICSDVLIDTGSGESPTSAIACELGHMSGKSSTMILTYEMVPGNDILLAKKVSCLSGHSEKAASVFLPMN
jgi:hypothetical protein